MRSLQRIVIILWLVVIAVLAILWVTSARAQSTPTCEQSAACLNEKVAARDAAFGVVLETLSRLLATERTNHADAREQLEQLRTELAALKKKLPPEPKASPSKPATLETK